MFGVRSLGFVVLCAMILGLAPPASADSTITNLPWVAAVTLEPGSMGYTGSPPIPPKVVGVKVTVSMDNDPLYGLVLIMAAMNKKQRLVFCARYGAEGIAYSANNTDAELRELSLTLACFQLMNQIPYSMVQAAAGPVTSSACPTRLYAAPATVTRSGGTYTTALNGAGKAVRKAPLRMKCTSSGNTVSLTLRTRRHQSLKKYLGQRVLLGLTPAASATATQSAKVTYQKFL